MIISLLINIIELIGIIYLLFLIVDKDEHYEYINSCYQQALKDLEEEQINKDLIEKIRLIAKKSDMLPCADFYADCENCKDKTTDNGKTCMRKGLKRILEMVGE